MPIGLDGWLDVIRREYVDSFIPESGSAVRVVVGDDDVLAGAGQRLAAAAEEAGLTVVRIDTATVKLHMLHQAFYAIAAAVDWRAVAQARLRSLVAEAGYETPDGPLPNLAALAEANGVAPVLLRTTLQQQITRSVWEDGRLAHDFRKAMIGLLDSCLADHAEPVGAGVIAWLRGELRSLKDVREAQIGARIGRQNARAMLVSLCHWLRSCGHRGVFVLLDTRQLLLERREIGHGLAYSPAAVMDCYEVLRQVIDDTEEFEGLLLVALGSPRLINDDVPRRSLTQYTALKMRVWDDVRPQGRDNPLAPLARLV